MSHFIIRNILFIFVMFASYLQASSEIDLCCKLVGEDISETRQLPFSYYQYDKNDCFTVIRQSHYKIYEIAKSSNDVIVISPNHPNVIIVMTDGIKLAVFDKGWSNFVQSISGILQKELNLGDKENLRARVFSVDYNNLWQKEYSDKCAGMHLYEKIEMVKDFLCENLGILSLKAPARIFSITDKNNQLWPFCIAIKMNTIFQVNDQDLFQIIDENVWKTIFSTMTS